MEFYSYKVIIEPEEGGGYHGFVPLLKGVHVCSDTVDRTKSDLKEAIKCHIQGLVKDGEYIPREEDVFESVATFSDAEFAFSA
jgi:predicted RNase H-like HicB family nuclease